MMSFDASFFQRLLDTEDLLAVVWDEMLAIWQTHLFPEDVVAFYRGRENQFSHFEKALYHGYGELYDLLLEKAEAQDGNYVRQRLQGDSIVIVADSLSMREVSLLRHRLSQQGWELSMEGFAIAPFPTMTESLAQKLLGVPSPAQAQGRNMAGFLYCYVAGPGEVPKLPTGEPTLVWLRLPDSELEQITVAQTTSIDDVLRVTTEALSRLLGQVGDRSVFITSDHGYLYADQPGHFWEMSDAIEGEARKVFARESRTKPLSEEGIKALRRHPEIFTFGTTHVAMKGRWWWTGGSQNDRCTAHGGLSVAEALVPVLRISGV